MSAKGLETCKECGVENAPMAPKCWLCGRPDWRGGKEKGLPWDDEGPLAETWRVADAPGAPFFTPGTVALLIGATLVTIGAARESPGLAALFALITYPGVLLTAARSRAAQREGRPLPLWEKTLVLLHYVVVMPIALMGALALATLATCFVICSTMRGGG